MVIIIKYKYLLVIFIFITIYIGVYYILNHRSYAYKLETKTNLIIEVGNAPRGKIYDVNGNILVDNKIINNLVFSYSSGIDIVDVAMKLASVYDFSVPSEKEMINWYKARYNANKLLSDEEKRLIKERKIDREEIINLKIKDVIYSYSDYDKNCSKVYGILNNGYLYYPKIIIEDISEEEISLIINNLPKGVSIETSYKRDYPYSDTLRNVFGKVGKITKDNKEEYLAMGYNLDDEVGLSYLEKYYDKYLRGEKAKYFVNDDYTLTKITEEKPGNDLYLSIDINLQKEVENIVKEELQKAKKYPNTEYLNDAYVILSNPKTGQIRAIAGQRYLKENEFNDIVINNISSSFTMGSVVKGATISVGYQNNLIEVGKEIYDDCVKLKNMTEKCSWKELGYLDSVTALEQSSNYYQFLLAIKLTGKTYTPNMELNVTQKEFDIYRNMLASYGLGIKTGIDLPNEKIGLIGDIIAPDLLLNLSIGQYDTYTPIELITYINTLASDGNRRRPSLVSSIKDSNGNTIYQNDFEVVDHVDISSKDMKLIQEGFYYVMNRGTGLGFMNRNLIPAGKTGTSESFYDKNFDGKIDTKTLTLTMAGYFPYDDPKYSMIVICPNASHNNSNKDYIYYITSRISREITDFLFENIVIP